MHRDISINNVMLSPPMRDGGHRQGFLINFDYAFIFWQLLGLDNVDNVECAKDKDCREEGSEQQDTVDEGVNGGVNGERSEVQRIRAGRERQPSGSRIIMRVQPEPTIQ